MCLLCLVLASGAQGDDWVGDKYGWKTLSADGDVSSLYATTNGGRSWREIFSIRSALEDFAHTGPTTGVVTTEPVWNPDVYWTRDNGRLWLNAASAIREPHDIEGHGSYLFWSRQASLYQVTPWPPRGDFARCKFKTAQDELFDGSICDYPRRPLRSRQVAQVSDAHCSRLANLPGGVAALFSCPASPESPFLRMIVYRQGKARVSTLPSVPPELQTKLNFLSFRLTVTWPSLQVVGLGPSGPPLVLWVSDDGAATWKVYY